MSQQQQQTHKRKLSLHDHITIWRFWLELRRTRHDPIAFKQVVENLAQESGVPPQDIPIVHNTFTAVREVEQAKTPAFVDLYLVGGMGAVDLILLPVLLSTSPADALLSAALFMLVLSLPLTAMSLFFSFLKQKYNIPTYGKIHSWLSAFALVTGAFSLDLTFWHVSTIYGIVFLFLAVVMYTWAAFYLFLIQAALQFNSLQEPPEAERTGAKTGTGDVESTSGESRGDEEGTK